MPAYLSSGSAIERALICGASVALPHAHFESEHTIRGSVIHSFLEACSKIGRDAALEQVDPDFADACAELNLDGLHLQLSLAAEVAIAYNPATDTARELGRGAGRAYDDVTIDEIPCTLDVVGVRDLPDGRRRGLYVEWKSGFTTRRMIHGVTQIDFGCLAMARCFDCDVVEGQLVHVAEELKPFVQHVVFDAWELDAFAALLREKHAEWKQLRTRLVDERIPLRDYETGSWCDRCPAREWCDAQTHQVRALINRDTFDGPSRIDMNALDDAGLAALWDAIPLAQQQLNHVKGKILGIANTRRIFLGRQPDGMERWLGVQVSDGKEKLEGEHVFDVVAEMPSETWREGVTGEDVATKATKITATKKDLEAALKDGVPRGKKAGTMRAVLERLKQIPGAITKKINVRPVEFLLPAGSSPSEPELPPGSERQLEAVDRPEDDTE